MKKLLKILGIISIFVIITNIFTMEISKSFASSIDVTEDPNSWKPYLWEETVGSWKFKHKVENLLGVIQVFGTAVSVITLAIIGLKYIMGSPEEKSQYKQDFIPWIIGAFMVFAITTIPSIIASLELF